MLPCGKSMAAPLVKLYLAFTQFRRERDRDMRQAQWQVFSATQTGIAANLLAVGGVFSTR